MDSYLDKESIDIKEIFNRHHHNSNSDSTTNHQGSIIQCSFTKETQNKNKQLTIEYDKAGLMYKQNFFCLEEKEMDNPIKPKAGNNFYETVIKNELNNDYLYCGYLDNKTNTIDNKNNNKPNSKESLMHISCSYCFNIITVNGIATEKGIFVCKKIDDVFKDYTEMYNINEVNEMVKDKALKESQFFNERTIKESTLKMFIAIKCLQCSNILGIKDSIIDNYIMFNCI